MSGASPWKSWLIIYHPDFRVRLKNGIRRTLRKTQPWTLPLRLERKMVWIASVHPPSLWIEVDKGTGSRTWGDPRFHTCFLLTDQSGNPNLSGRRFVIYARTFNLQRLDIFSFHSPLCAPNRKQWRARPSFFWCVRALGECLPHRHWNRFSISQRNRWGVNRVEGVAFTGDNQVLAIG